MKKTSRKPWTWFPAWMVGACLVVMVAPTQAARPSGKIGVDWGDPKGEMCTACHRQASPGMWQQWNQSQHGQSGVNCYDCHRAEEDDTDAFMHNGARISIIVSPKDCSRCHETEFEEMDGSHHSHAGRILASLDNLLGEVVGGPAAVNVGCRQCHGAVVEVGSDGKPTKETWPNTGIGRKNPDGSEGSCTACHGRHGFSKAQARTPETCGKCHIGPDHPQIEVYNESKHGIIYNARVEEMNLESDKWVAGVDYWAAPTCATCHMSAAPGIGKTHNVGERISWNLRAPVSKKIALVKLENGQEFDVPEGNPIPKVGAKSKGSKVAQVLTWSDRRDRMKKVCRSCHAEGMVTGFYHQFDALVDLYNEKFAKPVKAIMADLKKEGLITPQPFDEKIEWIWWEIWHHEGRRARHGASMSGPDYAWWHGIYDVAKHTYFKFIPELKKVAGEDKAKELLDKHFKPIAGHAWYFEGMGKEQIDKIRKGYEERYGKGTFSG